MATRTNAPPKLMYRIRTSITRGGETDPAEYYSTQTLHDIVRYAVVEWMHRGKYPHLLQQADKIEILIEREPLP